MDVRRRYVVRFALDLLLWELLGFMTNKIAAAIARANNLTLVADNLPLVGNVGQLSRSARLMMCCCCFNSSCKTCPGCSTLSMGSRLKGALLVAGH